MLTAAAIMLVLMLAFRLLDLLVLVFGAIVLAVPVRALADLVTRWTGVPARLAFVTALLLIAASLALLCLLFGYRVGDQFRGLAETLPTAWSTLEGKLMSIPGGEHLVRQLRRLSPSGAGFFADIGSIALGLSAAFLDMLLVLFGAVFLASNPPLYRKGVLKLVPEARRGVVADALDDSGRALKRFLLGQLVSMTVVGLMTGVGLWMIGVPTALALGLIAGLLEAIPYAGPILAAVPGVLIALLHGPETALWAAGLYLGVQQVEGSLVMPIVQHKAVYLPPALTVFGVVAGGVVFGTVGLIFAAPLLVVSYVLVKRLYVKEALGTQTPIPGAR
ncbi:AI-2E family transporter [Sphingomonas parva]|nr:AI-2E family transporter [Sphingomonas parva]